MPDSPNKMDVNTPPSNQSANCTRLRRKQWRIHVLNALGAVETYANSIDASGQFSGVYIDAFARRRLPLAILPRP